MKTIIKITVFIIFSIFLFSCNEELVEQTQTGILKGKVVRRGSNEPLANVKIFTSPTTKTVFSGTDGTFEIQICQLVIILSRLSFLVILQTL